MLRLAENEYAALHRLRKELEERFSLIDIIVFGSKARGDDSEDSDIDIMIKLERYTPAIESVVDDIIFSINLYYDTFISATIFGKDELESGPLSESPIYKVIEREGVRL
jgi:predicted nucleotidyltransferase